MKNTKLWSIVLAVITVVSLILDTVNLEPFGINTETIGKISALLTIVKLIYDNRALFTEAEMTDFANEVMKNDEVKSNLLKGKVTHADFENWKLKNRS